MTEEEADGGTDTVYTTANINLQSNIENVAVDEGAVPAGSTLFEFKGERQSL